jgi:hypothetical protein
MKTLYINKLSPRFHEQVQSRGPKSFNKAADIVSAMWKQEFLNGEEAPKHKAFTLIPVTESIEDSVK